MKALPDMQPHTKAKHQILKRYVDAWFPILGMRHPIVNYIDGFAGPGEYSKGEEGSPLIVLRSAINHIQAGTLPPDIRIRMAFVEAEPDYYEHLCSKLNTLEIPQQITVRRYPGEFVQAMKDVFGSTKQGTTIGPTFAFVDPFGFKGIPFTLMKQILSMPSCEVFINVMTDFMNRFLEHPNERIVAHIPDTFGTNEVLNIPDQASDRISSLLALYERQLTSTAKFVGRFDMKNKQNKLLYALYFASNSAKGFVKMKEAMWTVDQNEGGLFSDREGTEYQLGLFSLAPLDEALSAQYRGRTVPVAEIERFVEERTRFLPKHMRSVLKERESKRRIRVHPVEGYQRRPGTFKSGCVEIEFVS